MPRSTTDIYIREPPPMPEAVFWDSVAHIALGNRSDALHGAAVDLSRQLAAARTPIVTTDAVLTEVLNTFGRVAWRPLAVRIIDAVQESAAEGTATVVRIDAPLWERAVQLFRERPDRVGTDRLHGFCRDE